MRISEQSALVTEQNGQQEQMVVNCDTVNTVPASEEQQFKVIGNKAKGTEAGIHVPRKNVAKAENERTKGQKTKSITNQFQVLDGMCTEAVVEECRPTDSGCSNQIRTKPKQQKAQVGMSSKRKHL